MSKKRPEQIPGFYFDEEKNRYYKLLPGQEHINPLNGKILVKKKSSVKRNNNKIPKKKRSTAVSLTFTKAFFTRQQTVMNLRSTLSFKNSINGIVASRLRENQCFVLSDNFLPASTERNIIKLTFSNDLKQLFLMSKIGPHGDIMAGIVKDINKTNYIKQMLHDCILLKDFNDEGLFDVMFAPIISPDNEGIFFCGTSGFGKSYIAVQPNIKLDNVFIRKTTDLPFAMEWVYSTTFPYCFVYSVASNLILVKNIATHFNASCRNFDTADVIKCGHKHEAKTIHSIHCDSLIYVGYKHGDISVYDPRSLRQASVLQSDEKLKLVASIKALSDERRVLSRHCGLSDCIQLWDIRNPRKSLIKYRENNCRSSLVIKRKFQQIFVDCNESIVSSAVHGNKVQLWDLNSGKKLLDVDKLDFGLYQNHWPLMGNEAGMMGLKNNSVVWLPLQSSTVHC